MEEGWVKTWENIFKHFFQNVSFFLSGLLVMVMVLGHKTFVPPGKEGGGPDGGEDFLGRGSDRLGSGPE